MGNHLFVIFAVLDVLFAINSFLSCSFFTFITSNHHSPFSCLSVGECFQRFEFHLGIKVHRTYFMWKFSLSVCYY